MTTTPAVPEQTGLAVERTRLAYERTLMAWVRTGASLISFGFTIYKGFQFIANQPGQHMGMIGPRGFGLMMISAGIGSLILAAFENHHSLAALRARYGPELVPRSRSIFIAGIVVVLGALGLVAAALRI